MPEVILEEEEFENQRKGEVRGADETHETHGKRRAFARR